MPMSTQAARVVLGVALAIGFLSSLYWIGVMLYLMARYLWARLQSLESPALAISIALAASLSLALIFSDLTTSIAAAMVLLVLMAITDPVGLLWLMAEVLLMVSPTVTVVTTGIAMACYLWKGRAEDERTSLVRAVYAGLLFITGVLWIMLTGEHLLCIGPFPFL